MGKGNKKLTKRWFYIIVTLTYVIIAIISLTLFCLKFDITTILSFLGVTVSPSAPAFLAIFLSQYSAQAEDTQKGERLKDIQIKKEISIAFIRHYRDVKKELEQLPNKIQSYSRHRSLLIGIHLEEWNMSIIDKAKINNVEKAILHFKACNPGFLEMLNKSESKVNNINENIDELENKVLDFLKKNNKNNAINVANSSQQSTNCPNEIIGESVFRAVYDIWKDKDDSTKTISSLEKGISGSIPTSPTTFGDIEIDKDNIMFQNSLRLAKTDSFKSGIDVLILILRLIKDDDLKSQYTSITSECNMIKELRGKFTENCDEIIQKIDRNELLNILKCCPYHEYKDDIMSYFGYSGLYETE